MNFSFGNIFQARQSARIPSLSIPEIRDEPVIIPQQESLGSPLAKLIQETNLFISKQKSKNDMDILEKRPTRSRPGSGSLPVTGSWDTGLSLTGDHRPPSSSRRNNTTDVSTSSSAAIQYQGLASIRPSSSSIYDPQGIFSTPLIYAYLYERNEVL